MGRLKITGVLLGLGLLAMGLLVTELGFTARAGAAPAKALQTAQAQPIADMQTAEGQWKIAGKFQVSELKQVASAKKGPRTEQLVKINFTPLGKGQGQKQLFLVSRFGHPSLRVGAQLDLVAIGRGDQKAASLEALQVLIFVEQGNRRLPVWILSHRQQSLDLRGVSFFKMDSPDFVII